MGTACNGTSAEEGTASTTIVAVWPSVPESIDPGTYMGRTTVMLSTQFMGRLVHFDNSGVSEDQVVSAQDVKAGMAESFEPSEDFKTYTFTLRQGVTSAYGNELTAEDVQWSIMRSLEVDAVSKTIYQAANLDFENPITVTGKYEFEIHYVAPSAMAPTIFVWGGAGIYDSTEAKKHSTADDPWAQKWLARNSASFGPYHVESFNPGTDITLVVNDNYWGDKPYYKKIVIKAVPESSSRIQLVTSGEAQFATSIATNTAESLSNREGVTVEVSPGSNRDILVLNLSDPIFKDARVRRAVSLALNRGEIAEGVYGGYAAPAVDCISGSIDHPKPSNLLPTSADVEAARRLLAEAGHPDGFSFTLTFSTARPGPYATDLSRVIQSQLAQVGIDVKLSQATSSSKFQDAVNNSSLQAWLYNEQPALADAGYAFFLNNHTEGFGNNQNYSNPTFDRLVDTILRTPKGTEREAAVVSACELQQEEQPIVYLVETKYVAARSSDIDGYYHYPTDAPNFWDWRPKA